MVGVGGSFKFPRKMLHVKPDNDLLKPKFDQYLNIITQPWNYQKQAY